MSCASGARALEDEGAEPLKTADLEHISGALQLVDLAFLLLLDDLHFGEEFFALPFLLLLAPLQLLLEEGQLEVWYLVVEHVLEHYDAVLQVLQLVVEFRVLCLHLARLDGLLHVLRQQVEVLVLLPVVRRILVVFLRARLGRW